MYDLRRELKVPEWRCVLGGILRLTLDEAADYRLLSRVYDEIEYTDTVPIREAIDLIDADGLAELNRDVRQKEL